MNDFTIILLNFVSKKTNYALEFWLGFGLIVSLVLFGCYFWTLDKWKKLEEGKKKKILKWVLIITGILMVVPIILMVLMKLFSSSPRMLNVSKKSKNSTNQNSDENKKLENEE
ncbi:hypothetical protein [Spiroplasma culicicola]|uniref:Transmembrane protein n=1 Tax=Spiroplasma culicicola AES-1 TaxID=1276246 RepID=W6AHI5_9MOLU|nr:hypothetical protein [Spiroplasma culicicola]AHI53169.1 hypothetical protein SCULI_v1c08290 [Spiroplasma culicicola AES-1]